MLLISVSIPLAVWIACNIIGMKNGLIFDGVSIPQAVWIACNIMKLQDLSTIEFVSIPQAVWIACNIVVGLLAFAILSVSIPQAVWIACNQRIKSCRNGTRSFNTASGMDCMQFLTEDRQLSFLWFQYRKRYGLHAMR